MPRIILVLSVVLAVLCGLLFTLRSITPRSTLVATPLGPWQFSSHNGAPDNTPYARARLFLSGELPVAAGQGFTLRAYTDSAGATLERRCRYRLASPLPAARYFTLTLTDAQGRPVPNLVERSSFTSSSLVREADGRFEFLIGPEPEAGNWLPSGTGGGVFVLDLRFYDTPLSATATHLSPEALPRLEKRGCPA